ncbi:MAG TPA: Hsp20/alpha crystallin family protein [Solirubrobacteraceae bacterium]|nr:Hsp20/alpha crystallin family protein [Solirubrobacteraceae bacterium]
MALIRWEPVPVNRFFNSFFDTPTVAPATGLRRFTPAIDIIERDEDYLVRADLPGLTEKDVDIEFENDVLTISGSRTTAHEESRDGYRRIERSSGAFRRALRLPEGVDPEALSAQFANGVLEIAVPKPEQRKPRKVAITVGPGASAPAVESGAETVGEGEAAPQTA